MANYEQFEKDSIEILRNAHNEHEKGLRILSSFGVDSALTIRLAKLAHIPLQVVTVDTGFWFPETYTHRRQLAQSEGIFTATYSPGQAEIATITAQELWETDLEEYTRRTKAEPLSRAVRNLGITALVSGVRADQTLNRAGLETYGVGSDGEVRVNAVLDWPEQVVDEYFAAKGLLRHPLYYKGYGSVGDWTLTMPGEGRAGRNLGEHSECGINIEPELAASLH